MKNRRKAVQPFEIKKRKIDIFRNYEANGFEKNQRKFENFSTLISKKSTLPSPRAETIEKDDLRNCKVTHGMWFLAKHISIARQGVRFPLSAFKSKSYLLISIFSS